MPSGFGMSIAMPRLTWAGCDDRRLAVDLVVVDVLAGEVLERLDHRPADEVGERHLAAAGALQVVVDDDAVVDHELRRHGAHARRGRHRQAHVHVGGEGLRHPLERGHRLLWLAGPSAACGAACVGAWAGMGCGFAWTEVVLATGWLPFGVGVGALGCRGRAAPALPEPALPEAGAAGAGAAELARRAAGAGADAAGAGAARYQPWRHGLRHLAGVDRLVVLQDRPPGLIDRVPVDDETFVHFVDEPFVGSELVRGSTLRCQSGNLARHSRPPTFRCRCFKYCVHGRRRSHCSQA